MAASRRPLITSAVAGGLLVALWFVPSANASHEAEQAVAARSASAPAEPAPAPVTAPAQGPATPDAPDAPDEAVGAHLADTGGFTSAPYVAAGVTLLGAGAALLAHAGRRAHA
ncbi:MULTISPECIES: hypothetical protein [Streptomyces]|uniref:hypothetical protein n=1 Tax=Streptomyces TaxID=1883 RepID=UPI0022491A1D|nr:hypothetical protein [Streptomyces sp. JHD 1]MCX2969206.1 hypothetical protein [Streptomyces sp. JHD 1]